MAISTAKSTASAATIPFAQEAWAQKEKINVTLLSDYEHKVANSYGVAYESFLPQLNLGFAGVAKRSAFLMDRDGVIQYAEVHETHASCQISTRSKRSSRS